MIVTTLAIIGSISVVCFLIFLHISFRILFDPYNQFWINVSNVFHTPYLMVRVLGYDNPTLSRLNKSVIGKRWSERLLKWWMEKQITKRDLNKTSNNE